MEQLPHLKDYYHVFVGNLPKETTDNDLCEIFKGCEGIASIHVVGNSHHSVYKFGFVRFHTKENALSAVAEMNHWTFKGVRLLVDIAKTTKDRLQKEKLGVFDEAVTVPYWKSPEHQKSIHPKPMRSSSICVEQDVLNMSRLKETCNNLNLEMMRGVGSKGIEPQLLDSWHVLDDIEKSPYSREPTYNGDYDDSHLEYEKIKDKLLNSTYSGRSTLGEEQAKTFMNALQEIMKTVDVFVNGNFPDSKIPEYESDKLPRKNKNSPYGENNDNHAHLYPVSELSPRSRAESSRGEEYCDRFDDNDSGLSDKLSNKLEIFGKNKTWQSCDSLSDSDICDCPNDSGLESDFLDQSTCAHRLSDQFQYGVCVDDDLSKEQKKSLTPVEVGVTVKGSHQDQDDIVLHFLQTVGRGRGLSRPTTRSIPLGPMGRGFHSTLH